MGSSVNYLAVLSCGIASVILGTLWYGKLFGKPWMAIMGFTAETMAAAKKDPGKMYMSYALAFLGAMVMAYVLMHVIAFGAAATGTSGLEAGLTAAAWSWLGFVAPVTMSTVLWDGKPWKLWYITSGYYLVQMLVFGAILSSWR